MFALKPSGLQTLFGVNRELKFKLNKILHQRIKNQQLKSKGVQ